MDASYVQLLETLRSARTTMGAQLDRLSKPMMLDPPRLQVLHKEAGQFSRFAGGALVRMRREAMEGELVSEAQDLLRFFEDAQQRAATILQRGRKGA